MSPSKSWSMNGTRATPHLIWRMWGYMCAFKIGFRIWMWLLFRRASATFEKKVYPGEHNLAPVWRNRICSITTDGTSNMTGQSQGIASACNMMHFLDSKDWMPSASWVSMAHVGSTLCFKNSSSTKWLLLWTCQRSTLGLHETSWQRLSLYGVDPATMRKRKGRAARQEKVVNWDRMWQPNLGSTKWSFQMAIVLPWQRFSMKMNLL